MKTRIQLMMTLILSGSILFLNSCGDPLPEDKGTASTASAGTLYPIEAAFEIVAKENDIARMLYTKAIVGEGKKQGLAFDEKWQKDEVEAGPLPALFLRGISSDILKKGAVPLGLFLGSDFPVNNANKFKGKQVEIFESIKSDEKPKFFYDEDLKLHTAMFPDYASAAPCVSCHNDHQESPKHDWKMGDIMGATTWTYPKDSVTFDEIKGIILAYREGIVNTMGLYIKEIEGFKTATKPEVGDKWPAQGLFIPKPEVFLDSVKVLASAKTLNAILVK